jgi:hypothetical protein
VLWCVAISLVGASRHCLSAKRREREARKIAIAIALVIVEFGDPVQYRNTIGSRPARWRWRRVLELVTKLPAFLAETEFTHGRQKDLFRKARGQKCRGFWLEH